MAADVLSTGFWEIGNYKHNVKRIKDGLDQLDDFSKMNRERAEIEAKYSKMLANYSEKWRLHVDRAVPTGCIKTVWNALIEEAITTSNVHNNLKEHLLEDVIKETSNYRKNNLHVSVFKGPKEIREIEDGYDKAQKPWKKRYDKMEEKRQKYFSACRQEKSALVNLQNCQADSSISADGTTKFRERHEKMKEEVQKTRVEYEKALANLNEYRSVYEEAMNHVFKCCQDRELQRSQFLIDMISITQKFELDLIKNSQLAGLHQQLEQTILSSNTEAIKKDLSQWSKVYGVEANCQWPVFVEYSPEIRNIASKGGSAAKTVGGVVLTRQIIVNDDVPPLSTASISAPSITTNVSTNFETGKGSPKSSSDSDTNTFDSRKHNKYNSKKLQQHQQQNWNQANGPESPPLSTATPDSSKYGDFEEFTICKTGVVLYDYKPAENDEIQLQKGETIDVLSEPDSLGWCTGRSKGNIGLFPASYVQCIEKKM
ncbi:unnamed protein product [Caenorhabditis bovis]|uniref:Uncharacterized protein n=1 Tax=Caenorhabditis bovis TaxID=2654633 RepID=A0A8S1FF99_9PELO|nr:unnamed protein product [Caenorhabditis bovis]